MSVERDLWDRIQNLARRLRFLEANAESGGGGAGAPTDASYITTAAEAGLSAEKVLGTAVIMKGATAAIPAASIAGRLYIESDLLKRVFRDTGGAWEEVGRFVDGVYAPVGMAAAPFVTTAADANLSAEVVLGTGVIMTGTTAAIPAASIAGRLYFENDLLKRIFRDTGAVWTEVGRYSDGVYAPVAVAGASFVTMSAEASLSNESRLGSAVIMLNLTANCPAAGTAGRIYIEQDVLRRILRDNGVTWDEIGRFVDGVYIPKSLVTEQGDIIYASDASTPAALAHGTAGQVLQSGGHAANPSWTTPPPTDYAYLGFGAAAGLSAEANLQTFVGKNLVKNSPGQIVYDNQEPYWWDDVANATLTDVDLAGEGIAEKAKRAFKCVTSANDVYGYQTFTFADEDLLDAGETVVSIGCWVYCVAAAKASIGLYGTNLTLFESAQHTGDSTWQWLEVSAKTLHAADTSVEFRMIVDTGTAYFTMPVLNVGPRAMPWTPRGQKYVAKTTSTDLIGALKTDTALTSVDATAATHNLATVVREMCFFKEANGTVGSYSGWYDGLYAGATQVLNLYVVVVNGLFMITQADMQLDEGQLYYYDVAEVDNDTDTYLIHRVVGYFMWE